MEWREVRDGVLVACDHSVAVDSFDLPAVLGADQPDRHGSCSGNVPSPRFTYTGTLLIGLVFFPIEIELLKNRFHRLDEVG